MSPITKTAFSKLFLPAPQHYITIFLSVSFSLFLPSEPPSWPHCCFFSPPSYYVLISELASSRVSFFFLFFNSISLLLVNMLDWNIIVTESKLWLHYPPFPNLHFPHCFLFLLLFISLFLNSFSIHCYFLSVFFSFFNSLPPNSFLFPLFISLLLMFPFFVFIPSLNLTIPKLLFSPHCFLFSFSSFIYPQICFLLMFLSLFLSLYP